MFLTFTFFYPRYLICR